MLSSSWSNAFTVLVVGMGLVILILLLLVFVLQVFRQLLVFLDKKRVTVQPVAKPAAIPKGIDEGVVVAITTAMHLYASDEYHDNEPTIITIRHDGQSYSPWNSKIFNHGPM